MTPTPSTIIERRRSLGPGTSAPANASPTAAIQKAEGKGTGDNGTGLVLLLPHLVCCGGVALLSVLGGAGLVATGVGQASFWLVVAGLIVALIAGVWIVRRRLGEPRR